MRPSLKLLEGNPEAPAPMPRLALTGPVRVERRASALPNCVTLAAVVGEGADAVVIGSLSLPFKCMDMQDDRWLRERAERLARYYSTTLQLVH